MLEAAMVWNVDKLTKVNFFLVAVVIKEFYTL